MKGQGTGTMMKGMHGMGTKPEEWRGFRNFRPLAVHPKGEKPNRNFALFHLVPFVNGFRPAVGGVFVALR
jgi:hypothetical protein